MKKILCLLALSAVAALPVAANAQASAAPVAATAGKALYAADGKRLAVVYRVLPDGSPQVIINGKMVTVPSSTLTSDGSKVLTSMTKAQLASAR